MQWGIQEHLLHGDNAYARFQHAEQLGIRYVEVWARGLDSRIEDLFTAMERTQVRVASINLTQFDGYIAADDNIRRNALMRLQSAMTLSADLGADHVTFTPYIAAGNPDHDQERESMIWLLRTVSDFADAFDVMLHMLPLPSSQSHFMNTLAQAASLCGEIRNHPNVRIAPRCDVLWQEEDNAIQTSQQYQDLIHTVYATNREGRFPTSMDVIKDVLDSSQPARVVISDIRDHVAKNEVDAGLGWFATLNQNGS